MLVTVNGENKDVSADISIAALLGDYGLDRNRVAVELNGRLVKRAFFDETSLSDGDALEIVTLVGGG